MLWAVSHAQPKGAYREAGGHNEAPHRSTGWGLLSAGTATLQIRRLWARARWYGCSAERGSRGSCSAATAARALCQGRGLGGLDLVAWLVANPRGEMARGVCAADRGVHGYLQSGGLGDLDLVLWLFVSLRREQEARDSWPGCMALPLPYWSKQLRASAPLLWVFVGSCRRKGWGLLR